MQIASIRLGDPFKDKNGERVIFQSPNTPLVIAILFYFLQKLEQPFLFLLSLWGFRIALTYWAYLEITQGVNPWRRFLGVVVFLWLFYAIATAYLL